MPSYMPHLFVAKKVNSNAKIDFYIGNIAPDSVSDREKKRISHLRDAPDMESALREFALKIDKNEYLKGVLLHLFVDWQWNDLLILPDFIKKTGDGWYQKYWDEGSLVESYAFHNTGWAYELWEQMDLCDTFDFAETDFIIKEDIKAMVKRSRKWKMETRIGPSTAFPPSAIDKFANDTAANFDKWFADLASPSK